MAKHRYQHHLKNFHSIINSVLSELNHDSKVAAPHFFYEKDGRTPFFQLQGLARIDSKISKHKQVAEKWLNSFKELEDAFGKYDYWYVMTENNKNWKFPQEVQKYFESQASFHLGVLEAKLIQHGWIQKVGEKYIQSDDAVQRFKKLAKKADWYSSEKERDKLLKFYRDEASEINDKLISKEIDLNLVEEGIHEFRRKARWLGIYSSALLGKVSIGNPKSNDAMSEYVTKKNQEFKFNKLPLNEKEKNIVQFLPGGFYAMSELIKNIGDIKDPALSTEQMQKTGKLFGLSEAQIKKHLGKDYKPHHVAVPQAKKAISDMVIKKKLFHHIADYFDKQIK
jgi:hypothetical protein